MLRVGFLFAAIICSVSFAVAETGLSLIGLCHKTWDCKSTLEYFNKQPKITLGFLTGNTFADNCACAEQVLAIDKPKKVRIHIMNSTCLRSRGRVCGEHEPFAGSELKQIEKEIAQQNPIFLEKYNKLLDQAGTLLSASKNQTECYISPCLECDLSSGSRKILLNMAKQKFPNCQIVDNPYRDKCLPAYVCERHGPKAELTATCIADLDGDEISKEQRIDFMKRYQICEMSLIWEKKFNCLEASDFVLPTLRQCPALGDSFDSMP